MNPIYRPNSQLLSQLEFLENTVFSFDKIAASNGGYVRLNLLYTLPFDQQRNFIEQFNESHHRNL